MEFSLSIAWQEKRMREGEEIRVTFSLAGNSIIGKRKGWDDDDESDAGDEMRG